MALGNKKMKERVAKLLCEACENPNASEEYKALAKEWIENKEDADKTKEIAPKLRAAIRALLLPVAPSTRNCRPSTTIW